MANKLSAFLHPAIINEEKEVVISKRFLGDDGKPVPFKIRSLTQEENEALRKKATHVTKVNGQRVEKVDSSEYTRRLLLAGTVFPDFSAAELCEQYGTLDPLQVPAKMLLSGEYARLSEAILKLSGFDDTPEGEAALDEEVKN